MINQTTTPKFLLWFDDSAKKSADQKVADGMDAYRKKEGRPATLIWINGETVAAAPAGVTVEAKSFIQKHHYWIGESPS